MNKRSIARFFWLPWREEKGNGTILVLGMVMGILGLMLMMAAMSQVYIGKRQMQTAADAAALAAHKKLVEKFGEELEDYAQEVIDEFLDSILESIPPEEDWRDVVRDTIENDDLENAIIYGRRVPVSLVVKEPCFSSSFDQRAMSRLLYETARDNWDVLKDEAQRLARLNGAEEDVYLEFPVDGQAMLYVEVKGKIKLPVYDHLLSDDSRMIHVGASTMYRNSTFEFDSFDLSGAGFRRLGM